MKNIELFIIAVIAAFAFVGCCHTHHHHRRASYFEYDRFGRRPPKVVVPKHHGWHNLNHGRHHKKKHR